MNTDDWLDDKRENYQNYSVLLCVWHIVHTGIYYSDGKSGDTTTTGTRTKNVMDYSAAITQLRGHFTKTILYY